MDPVNMLPYMAELSLQVELRLLISWVLSREIILDYPRVFKSGGQGLPWQSSD